MLFSIKVYNIFLLIYILYTVKRVLVNISNTSNSRIDFYLLKTTTYDLELAFICRLIEKAYSKGFCVFVLAADKEEAKIIDNKLWTFRPDSFIPHTVINENNRKNNIEHPVIIGDRITNVVKGSVLISMNSNLMPESTLFSRVCHIIPNDEQYKENARYLYKQYRTQGVKPNHFNIN